MGKPLWETQNLSRNVFFPGKHHPVPAVYGSKMEHVAQGSYSDACQRMLTQIHDMPCGGWHS